MGDFFRKYSAEILFGILLSVLAVIIDFTWWIRLPLALFAIGIIWHLFWRIELRPVWRYIGAIASTLIVVAGSWGPIWAGMRPDFEHPLVSVDPAPRPSVPAPITTPPISPKPPFIAPAPPVNMEPGAFYSLFDGMTDAQKEERFALFRGRLMPNVEGVVQNVVPISRGRFFVVIESVDHGKDATTMLTFDAQDAQRVNALRIGDRIRVKGYISGILTLDRCELLDGPMP
jgi:hypothetical protein